jgi:hypothetical protein
VRGSSSATGSAEFRVQVGHRTVLRTKSKERAMQAGEYHAGKPANDTVTVKVLDPEGRIIWERKRKHGK